MPDNSTPEPAGTAAGPDAHNISDNDGTAVSENDTAVPDGDAVVPQDLKMKLAEQKLEVLWMDGRRSVFSSAMLRKYCPCAVCQAGADESKCATESTCAAEGTCAPEIACAPGSKSASETGQDRVDILSAQLVGTYAIQFDFSDGHNTGIYNFRYLRTLPTLA